MMSQFHLADLFESVAARVPSRIALADDKGEVTYAQMEARASRLAVGLYAQGVRRGDHIGLYLMNGPEYLESFFAILKIGAVPFNVNYRYGYDELKNLFGNAQAKAVIHGAEFSALVEKLTTALPNLTLSIAVEDGQGVTSASLSYEALMQSSLAPASSASLDFERHEEDYLLQYTGGTTGLPKGVMWPHKAFFFACLGGGGMYARKPPIETPEAQADIAEGSFPIRILPVAPLMHGAAIWTALSGLLGGMTLVLDPMRGGFDAEKIWDRVEREEVNILQIVGDAMAVPLLNALKANSARWDLSRLIHFGSGGAVFSQHVKDALKLQLPHTMMGDGMGTSETGISGMGAPVKKDIEKETGKDSGFMRLPADDFQTVIFDGRVAEIGEIGYLSRAGHTPIGYYGDPEKTEAIFQNINGTIWVLTGDQARLDGDGMMTILGRGSTCINSGGEKIYPEEVEQVLRAHPAIHDAAVVGLPDPKWGQAVSAVISVSPGEEAPTLEEVKSFCSEKLAGYKLPKALKIVLEIQRSPAGKQDYKWAKSVFED
ncbi:MAG: AMP-binding protein [Hellea sp.]